MKKEQHQVPRKQASHDSTTAVNNSRPRKAAGKRKMRGIWGPLGNKGENYQTTENQMAEKHNLFPNYKKNLSKVLDYYLFD